MIRPIPTGRLAWLAVLGVPLVLLGLFGRPHLALGVVYDLALLASALADWLASGDPAGIEVRRELPARWIQGRADLVRLELRSKGRGTGRGKRVLHVSRVSRVSLRDVPPPSFRVRSSRFEFSLRPDRIVEVSYAAVPRERGDHRFGPLAVRTRGPLGLVERQSVLDLDQPARVYPDLVSLSAREATLVRPDSWLAGTRRGRVHGEGREFHQLREYSPGDDARQIDWKAFARHGRPAVREYRAERNQRVLLLIDAGRLMSSRVGDRLRFDWAVQAAGRLARVALAFGDVVGLAFFSREVKAHLPPGRGPGHLTRLAELLCLAQHDLDDPDLGRALGTLLRGGSRRTLVVVFTELADPRAAEAAVRHIGSLAPRHLGLAVTLADVDLEAARDLVPRNADEVFRRIAADELWQDYRRTEHSLQARGALVARANSDALAAETVESYLAIKRRGRL